MKDLQVFSNMVLYESIIDELQRVEMLMLYYGLDRSDL